MKTLLRPGDCFRINTPRMCASGEIVKVNRATFDWRAKWFGHEVSGKIALHNLRRATIARSDGCAFSIL